MTRPPPVTRSPKELRIDFTGGAVAHRLRFGGGRGQALPKAIGMKGGKSPDVVDATAGFGRDSFLLASLGARVTMIERSERMFELLQDAMERATSAGGDIAEIISRMTLLHGDSIRLLGDLNPDVVLVDPMHPTRKNSALVKIEMRQIREIVGADNDSLALLEAALAAARNRVVLKWPQKADPIQGLRPPSHRINGKSTRYDVFMT